MCGQRKRTLKPPRSERNQNATSQLHIFPERDESKDSIHARQLFQQAVEIGEIRVLDDHATSAALVLDVNLEAERSLKLLFNFLHIDRRAERAWAPSFWSRDSAFPAPASPSGEQKAKDLRPVGPSFPGQDGTSVP